MKQLQWHSFEKKIYIHTTKAHLYKLWASEQGITSWFLKDAEFLDRNGKRRHPEDLIQIGDTYTWRWHN